jgi:hypothetical protein
MSVDAADNMEIKLVDGSAYIRTLFRGGCWLKMLHTTLSCCGLSPSLIGPMIRVKPKCGDVALDRLSSLLFSSVELMKCGVNPTPRYDNYGQASKGLSYPQNC